MRSYTQTPACLHRATLSAEASPLDARVQPNRPTEGAQSAPAPPLPAGARLWPAAPPALPLPPPPPPCCTPRQTGPTMCAAAGAWPADDEEQQQLVCGMAGPAAQLGNSISIRASNGRLQQYTPNGLPADQHHPLQARQAVSSAPGHLASGGRCARGWTPQQGAARAAPARRRGSATRPAPAEDGDRVGQEMQAEDALAGCNISNAAVSSSSSAQHKLVVLTASPHRPSAAAPAGSRQ